MFQLLETQCNECCSCWCTNASFLWAPFKDIFWYFCLPSFTKCFNIEGNLKKTALERMCEWSVVLWKIPLRTPLGCGSGFGFFQSRAVPPDKDKKDSKRDWLQKQISGKIVPLVFWKFLFLISIMHLTPKWRQILLFFCLYNNWPSMPDFKVNIIMNSTGVNKAKSF